MKSDCTLHYQLGFELLNLVFHLVVALDLLLSLLQSRHQCLHGAPKGPVFLHLFLQQPVLLHLLLQGVEHEPEVVVGQSLRVELLVIIVGAFHIAPILGVLALHERRTNKGEGTNDVRLRVGRVGWVDWRVEGEEDGVFALTGRCVFS